MQTWGALHSCKHRVFACLQRWSIWRSRSVSRTRAAVHVRLLAQTATLRPSRLSFSPTRLPPLLSVLGSATKAGTLTASCARQRVSASLAVAATAV